MPRSWAGGATRRPPAGSSTIARSARLTAGSTAATSSMPTNTWIPRASIFRSEELGGRSYAASPGGKLNDCTIGTTDCRFYGGDLIDAYEYLDTTSKHFQIGRAGRAELRGVPRREAQRLHDRHD